MFHHVTDESNTAGPLNIRVDLWGIQYEDFINEDFIIYKMLVTNIGTDTLSDVYIVKHDDPDTPEQGSQEWTDDFAALIPVGMDVEGYSSAEDSLLWNFTYLWDGDDRVQGLIANKVGWVGLKVLETPDDPAHPGQRKGLTTLDVFEYSMAPQTEDAEYDQLASGIKAPNNVTPHADDWTQTPNTYGPDITYVIASGPFELKPGASVPFALASLHGVNKKDLFNNAILCQILYNNNYAAAEAPPEPNVRAVAGDHQVTLYWNAFPTEAAVYPDGHVGDKLTGKNAFEGYKIYKSMDRGLTWGESMMDVYGAPRGYIPLAQYDLINGVSGESETRPFFYLGDDTGLRHVFVDNNVENGYEYWYAILAYDRDDGPIPPLENAFKKDASLAGDNVVAVVPQGKVYGYKFGVADTAAVQTSGTCDVSQIPVEIVDRSAVTGDKYEVAFKVDAGVTTFSVTDLTLNKLAKSGSQEVTAWSLFDAELDNAPIFDGVKLRVTNAEWGWKTAAWTTGNSNTVIQLHDWVYYDLGTSDDYEIRWTETLGDSGIYSSPPLPFVIFNLTRNAQLAHYIWDDDESGGWSSGDRVMFVEPDEAWTWVIQVFTAGEGITTPPVAGDVFSIVTNKPFTLADKYQFATTKESYTQVTAHDLSKITTVPNPFVVSSVYETNKFGIERKVQFHFLPPTCTIRIYNVSGDLIRTLEHTNGTAIESWNLLSYNQQEIAFGVYFYHVDAPNIGAYIGKMAVIK